MKPIAVVEEEVYNTKLRSGQDPLNFPIRLNNKIAALQGVVESSGERRLVALLVLRGCQGLNHQRDFVSRVRLL